MLGFCMSTCATSPEGIQTHTSRPRRALRPLLRLLERPRLKLSHDCNLVDELGREHRQPQQQVLACASCANAAEGLPAGRAWVREGTATPTQQPMEDAARFPCQVQNGNCALWKRNTSICQEHQDGRALEVVPDPQVVRGWQSLGYWPWL